MSHEIASTVKCRLCGETFVKPQGLLIQPGSDMAANRLAKFSIRLAEHFTTKHPQHNQGVDLQATAFQGMLRLMHFDIADPELHTQRDFLRWQVHQATIVGRLRDDTLEQRAAELAAEFIEPARTLDGAGAIQKIKARLIEVFKGYRDTVEETGRFKIGPAQQLDSAALKIPR